VKYPVILADPPWEFKAWSKNIGPNGRAPDKHYRTMATADIAKFVLPAADNCALFMWAVWPTMPDALELIRAWGFEYKTIAWVWTKLNETSMGTHMGLGYYTRANTEPCLLAVRGRMPVKAHDVQALIMSPVREHSRKPDEQYAKIERLYDGPYLEMFARRARPGWDAWGNEAPNSVTLAVQEQP
jgi:N6-adenosine-specific RNA methylase IME4